MRLSAKLNAVLLPCLLMAPLGHGSAFAQEAVPDEARTSGMSAPGVCLVSGGPMPQVLSLPGMGRRVLVAEPELANYLAKGFTVTACDGVFATHDERVRWRDWICTKASIPSEALQALFESRVGESAGALCGSAELIAGGWEHVMVSEGDAE